MSWRNGANLISPLSQSGKIEIMNKGIMDFLTAVLTFVG